MLDQGGARAVRLLDDYYNVDEVDSACINLAAAFPKLATLIALPEQSAEGRTSHALRLGGAAQQGAKPAFMVIGGLHGCEWGSCEIVLNLAADLLGAYQQQVSLAYGPNLQFSAASVSALLDATDIVLFPLVNPDGRHHSQTVKPSWRKNRNPAHSTRHEPRSIGVDINRNFDFLFDFGTAFTNTATGISTSSNPMDNCYQGQAAFSEPETRNVSWLLQRFPDTRWFVDLHSGAQDVIYPWGDDEVQHGDPLMNFANPAYDQQRGLPGDTYSEYQDAPDLQAMNGLANTFAQSALAVSNTAYGVTSGFKFAPSCGTSHDWVYSRHPNPQKTLAFAIEWCGDEYAPPWSRMLKIIEDVSAGLIAMGLAVLPQP